MPYARTQIVADAFRRVADPVSAYIESGVFIQAEYAIAARTPNRVAPTMKWSASVRTAFRARREIYRGAAVFSPDTPYACAQRCTVLGACTDVLAAIAVEGKADAWGAMYCGSRQPMGGGVVALMGPRAFRVARMAVRVEAANDIG